MKISLRHIFSLGLFCFACAGDLHGQGVYRELWTNLTTSVGSSLTALTKTADTATLLKQVPASSVEISAKLGVSRDQKEMTVRLSP